MAAVRRSAITPAAAPVAAATNRRAGVRVPVRYRDDIARILLPADRLQRRVRQLGRQIARESDERQLDLVVVALLSGTVFFLPDLLRAIDRPLRLDFLGVSSYRQGTTARELVFTKDLKLDVAGRDVLVVDDILDTGCTLEAVLQRLRSLRPRSLKTCVLLDKPARRTVPLAADYVGFAIPDEFVVGYGLDFEERHRNLPFVGVLHPRLYGA